MDCRHRWDGKRTAVPIVAFREVKKRRAMKRVSWWRYSGDVRVNLHQKTLQLAEHESYRNPLVKNGIA
jgi:hypothetical protein